MLRGPEIEIRFQTHSLCLGQFDRLEPDRLISLVPKETTPNVRARIELGEVFLKSLLIRRQMEHFLATGNRKPV